MRAAEMVPNLGQETDWPWESPLAPLWVRMSAEATARQLVLGLAGAWARDSAPELGLPTAGG